MDRGMTIHEIDEFSDILDSIDFEGIIKQKLAEKGFTSAKVEISNN